MRSGIRPIYPHVLLWRYILPYGWLNADDHDPEMVGHATAQTSSLSWRILEAKDKPNAPQIETWEKSLVVAGGDFEGLMEASRISIGLMLVHEKAWDFFSVHLMGSMFFLSAASDQLRDSYISAVFAETTKGRSPVAQQTYFGQLLPGRCYDCTSRIVLHCDAVWPPP
jgi:hypothetical protein